MTYIDPPVPADEVTVAETTLARFSEIDPDWVNPEGGVETSIAEAVATPVATANAMLSLTGRSSFAEVMGRYILGTPRDPATAATALATVTIDTSAGYTVAAGTEFSLTRDGELVTFVLPAPLEFATGTVTRTGVSLVAIDVGTGTNGASNPARSGDARVSSVTVTAISTGGADEEEIEVYLARLVSRSQRVKAYPITAPDFAGDMCDDESVERCIAFNRTNPADLEADSPGHVLLVPIDGLGASFPDGGAVLTRLSARPAVAGADRPLQVTVHFGQATSVPLGPVVVEVVGNPIYGEGDIQAAVKTALIARFDPSQHDYDAQAPGLWTQTTDEITDLDAAVAVGALTQVLRVTDVTFDGLPTVSLTPGVGDAIALPALLTESDITVNVTFP